MNSLERKQMRYQRRCQKRYTNKTNQISYSQTFTYTNLWNAFMQSLRGVYWKPSVQRFRNHAITSMSKVYNSLQNKTFKSKGFYEFDIVERGKPRHIKSVHISERVVQRCLCDKALVPILTKTFIYDNGACVKNKGIDFALNRMVKHLRDFYRNNGNEGYILQYDFSKFFDRINHSKLKILLKRQIKDKEILNLANQLIDDFKGDIGLGLGSQISQICALFYPSILDHYIKEILNLKYYGRYMDDGYLIFQNKEHLKVCLEKIKEITSILDIKLNVKKTHISKLSRGFTFLKVKFNLLSNGQILRRPFKGSIVRMKRKLKIYKRWVDEGKFTLEDVRMSYTSWRGHISKINSHMSVRSTDKLLINLFK